MLKTVAQIILIVNLVLMLVWVYQAGRFARLYNSSNPQGSAPIRLVSVLVGHQAAGHGLIWLLRGGYREHILPGVRAAGDRLRQLTIIFGVFSFTIPLVALLWSQRII
jgi:hypothetical protein